VRETNFAAMQGEVFENGEYRAGKRDGLVTAFDGARTGIEVTSPISMSGWLVRGAANERAQTSQEFRQVEGLTR